MHLTRLRLINYKNYSDQLLQFDHQVTALVGNNGMGKTNIIDAIYYTCMGRSYFSSRDIYVLRKEADFTRLESVYQKDGKQIKVEVKMIPSKLKELKTNGKKVPRMSEHIGKLPVVVVAPADINLLLGASEDRRKFVNNTIIQYDAIYLQHLITYTKLLKQRNALLKQFAEQRRFDQALLLSISERMYEAGDYIYQARMKFAEMIGLDFTRYYAEISGKQEDCQISLKSQLHDQNMEALMQESLEKDRVMTRTTAGIHKDDLKLKMDGDPLKNFASQGQLKSFVLALKLAQYSILKRVSGTQPILLLDDLFDKLDSNRVSQLLGLVMSEDFGQVVITDANRTRIPDILSKSGTPHDLYYISKGRASTTLHVSEEE